MSIGIKQSPAEAVALLRQIHVGKTEPALYLILSDLQQIAGTNDLVVDPDVVREQYVEFLSIHTLLNYVKDTLGYSKKLSYFIDEYKLLSDTDVGDIDSGSYLYGSRGSLDVQLTFIDKMDLVYRLNTMLPNSTVLADSSSIFQNCYVIKQH